MQRFRRRQAELYLRYEFWWSFNFSMNRVWRKKGNILGEKEESGGIKKVGYQLPPIVDDICLCMPWPSVWHIEFMNMFMFGFATTKPMNFWLHMHTCQFDTSLGRNQSDEHAVVVEELEFSSHTLVSVMLISDDTLAERGCRPNSMECGQGRLRWEARLAALLEAESAATKPWSACPNS